MKVDPEFSNKFSKFGSEAHINECFNCGNCTAICPLATEEEQFPRRFIRYMQLGLDDKLKTSLEPWLCYYCGECQQTCPRQANPGELMMAARRYLTTSYDWTGLGRKLYTSMAWKLASVAVLFVATLAIIWAYHGPIVTTHTELETFAPAHIVHPAGYIFGGVLGVLLLSNVFRMWRFTMGNLDVKVPFSLYASELKTLVVHFLTQMKLRLCGDAEAGIKSQWKPHILVMTGYTAAFILVQVDVFTFWSLTNNPPPAWHPAKLLWNYATIAMLYAIIVAMVGRLRKSDPIHQFSHSTDWMFLVLLFVTVFTGLLVRIFMELDLPLPTYYTFAAHLAFTVPLLGLEVPFTKWSHLAYRPFALYFANIKERAYELHKQKEQEKESQEEA